MNVTDSRIADNVWQIASVSGSGFVVSGGLVQARGYDLWTYGGNCIEVLPQVQEQNWLGSTTLIVFTNPSGCGFPGTELARNRQ